MFKYLFLILLLLIFVAPLRRFLFWLIVGRQIVNEQKKYQKSQNPPQRPEGEIKVDYIPKKDNNSPSSSGQYVDYEEVK
ncbi:MAG: DUF4834 domain-containing protein [Cytophagaceae bacterium]|nr:DUF4834 domain-containing protein [Cytophagaceae bacterium]MBK9509670.1 DUF4834 domain-containing protein [Cytophagaceae bacterium]MBK9936248.1 DUF4834 domain-containing protein [Cytophagaceae bacterium]MBL0303859.1 DUF4834 domain-containing protein [Cytophagaceae bacterium]